MPTRNPNGRTQSGAGRGRAPSRTPSRTTSRRASESAAPSRTVQRPTAQGDGASHPRGITLSLPFVTAHLEPTRHALNLPESLRGGRGGVFHPERIAVPSLGKAAYYAGLGALVVAQIVEWPIAAVIAVSTYVAQHTRPDGSALPKAAGATGADGGGGGGRAPSIP
ncbi:MAG: hypothetical protein ACQSGP_06840 [Frankia sp.]